MKTLSTEKTELEDYNVFTYRRVRRAIGYLGFFLPIFLVILSLFSFFKTPIQHSISDYYYTNFREILTGTLSAVGLFLIRYKGHGNVLIWKNDNLLTNIAGIMAIGVALVPTNPNNVSDKIYSFIPYAQEWLGTLHYLFAGVLFLVFTLLAINVFTIGQEKEFQGPKSTFNENNIYKFCGYSMLVFIIMVPISDKFKLFPYSTLAFESLSLFVFGIAWLIKGRALGDKGKIGQIIYCEHNPVNTEKSIEK